MVKSMTGFGKSTLSKEKREYQMEIKSVNHRYLDITIKMPKTLSYLEDEIKKEISSKIKRGKVDVYITYENGSQEQKHNNKQRTCKIIYKSTKRTSTRRTNIRQNRSHGNS